MRCHSSSFLPCPLWPSSCHLRAHHPLQSWLQFSSPPSRLPRSRSRSIQLAQAQGTCAGPPGRSVHVIINSALHIELCSNNVHQDRNFNPGTTACSQLGKRKSLQLSKQSLDISISVPLSLRPRVDTITISKVFF